MRFYASSNNSNTFTKKVRKKESKKKRKYQTSERKSYQTKFVFFPEWQWEYNNNDKSCSKTSEADRPPAVHDRSNGLEWQPHN